MRPRRRRLRRVRQSRTVPQPLRALKAFQPLSPPRTTQLPVAQVHASSSLVPLTTPTVSRAARQARRRISPMQMAARPLLRRRRGRLARRRAPNRRTSSARTAERIPSAPTVARAAGKRSARNHPAAASARPNARRSISRLAPNARLQPAAGRAAGRMAIEHRFGVGTSLRMTGCRPRILPVGGKVVTPIKHQMDGVTGPQMTMSQLRAFPVERRTSIRR